MVTAKEIMSREVVSTLPSCTVEQVTRVLYHHGISGLPVLDSEKRVIGMVTAGVGPRRSGSTYASSHA